MPLRVTCPNGHRLSLGDHFAGKRIKCPKCQVAFLVDTEEDEEATAIQAGAPKAKAKAAAAPAAKKKARVDDDDEDFGAGDDDKAPLSPEERRKARIKDKRRRLRIVNTGLLLHLIKMWIYVVLILATMLFFIFWMIVNVVSSLADKDLAPEAIALFAMLSGIFLIAMAAGVIIAPIVGVVGSGFCIFAPKKSEARGTIITSFVFDIIPMFGSLIVLMNTFNLFDLERDKQERLEELIRYGSSFFTLGAWFLFMVYLRQMGHYLGKSALGNEALNLIAYLIVEVVTLPITLILALYLFRWVILIVGSFLSIIIVFIIIILWFVQFYYLFFVGSIRLLNAMRQALREEYE